MSRVHLAVIVGREAGMIERFLRSFGPHVDRIALVHALGASQRDETGGIARQVCSELGVPLAQGEYFNSPGGRDWEHVDDFAGARNQSFALARDMGKPGSVMDPPWPGPDWLMWADADDLLSPEGAEFLRNLRRMKAEEVPADVMYGPYVTDAGGSYARRERVVRVSHFTRWVNVVHEVMEYSPDARVSWQPELKVVHVPAVDKRGSPTRNLRILLAKPEKERCGRDWFMLMREYQVLLMHANAMTAAVAAATREDLGLEERREAHLVIGRSMKEAEKAERFLLEVMRISPERREGYAEMVRAHLEKAGGDARKALAWARVMQGVPRPEEVQWTHDESVYGWRGDDLLWTAMERALKDGSGLRARAAGLRKAVCRISVAHPTCRPEKAIKIRELWLERARKPESIEYVFGCCAGDAGVVEGLCGYPRAISAPVPEGFSSAVANYNAAVQATSGPLVICAQDDIYPPHGWDDLVFAAMQKHLSLPRVLHVSDGHRKDELMVVQCVTRTWLRKYGTLFSPEYDGYYSDTEFSLRAYGAGEVIDGRHIGFFHDHPAFTGAVSDEAYMRQQNAEACARGKAIFERRNPLGQRPTFNVQRPTFKAQATGGGF